MGQSPHHISLWYGASATVVPLVSLYCPRSLSHHDADSGGESLPAHWHRRAAELRCRRWQNATLHGILKKKIWCWTRRCATLQFRSGQRQSLISRDPARSPSRAPCASTATQVSRPPQVDDVELVGPMSTYRVRLTLPTTIEPTTAQYDHMAAPSLRNRQNSSKLECSSRPPGHSLPCFYVSFATTFFPHIYNQLLIHEHVATCA